MKTFIPDYQDNVKRGPQIMWRNEHGRYDACNPVYLHGRLEDLAKFDIVYAEPIASEPCGIVYYMPAKYGQEQCTVVCDAGTFTAVFVWWWSKESTFRGLIVLPNDTRALEYAFAKQRQATDML